MSISLYKNDMMIRTGNLAFRYRNTVFPVALVILVVVFPPTIYWGGQWFDPWADVAALFVALAGEALRMLTVGLDYIKRGGVNKQVYASRLVTEGMFAHCRNPLYVGNILMAIALLTISGRLSAVVIGAPLIVLTYVAIVAAEEKYLRAAFPGDYEAYCRSTNRWIPDLRGLGGTLQNSEFNWRRVLLKETTSFYGWIVLAFLVTGIEHRFSLAQRDLQMFTTLFVAATIAFASIRILKRTGRLQL